MRIGILAVQGAFADHEHMLQRLGVSWVELRQKKDLDQPYDGLILPGGESTVQGKLLRELDMFQTLQQQIRDGMPVFATCAGLILLAEELSNDTKVHFQTLPVCVRRNAYGRQMGSFFTREPVAGLGPFPMEFIRAPYIESVKASCYDSVEILAQESDHIVAVRYQNQIATAFHPELTDDTRIHELFLSIVSDRNSLTAAG